MNNMFSVSFSLDGEEYYCLVYKSDTSYKRDYRFTIMNGTLERLMCTHNTLSEFDIENAFVPCDAGNKSAIIRKNIAVAVHNYLCSKPV